MRVCIAVLLILGLAGVAGAAGLTSNVGKVHGTQSPVLCSEPCRPGDINENEPVCYDGYYDYTNGGCNTQGWTQLQPGGDGVCRACGTSGTYYYGYYSYRDTDWYTAQAYVTPVIETVTAEFAPMLIIIYANSGEISCSNYTYVYALGTACVANTVTAHVPQYTTFWPWVATQVFGYGVPCGSRYLLDVTTGGGGPPPPPPPPQGACCLPNGSCQVMDQYSCEYAGGTYMGDDVQCAPELCGATSVEHSTWGSVKSRF